MRPNHLYNTLMSILFWRVQWYCYLLKVVCLSAEDSVQPPSPFVHKFLCGPQLKSDVGSCVYILIRPTSASVLIFIAVQITPIHPSMNQTLTQKAQCKNEWIVWLKDTVCQRLLSMMGVLTHVRYIVEFIWLKLVNKSFFLYRAHFFKGAMLLSTSLLGLFPCFPSVNDSQSVTCQHYGMEWESSNTDT